MTGSLSKRMHNKGSLTVSLSQKIPGTLSLLLAGCAPFIDEPRIDSAQVQIYSKLEQSLMNKSVAGSWNDALFDLQWSLKNMGQKSRQGIAGVVGADIQFSLVANLPQDLPTVTVAVLDTGLDLNHPDLDLERLDSNPGEQGVDIFGRDKSRNGVDDDHNGFPDDWLGWNFADNSAQISDSLGHGTHVSGLLIAKSGNAVGIAAPWKAIRILPVQVFSARSPSPEMLTLARAIRYAVDRGAKVISASFGTPTPSDELREAVAYAHQHDVVFVSAIGNFRTNISTAPNYPAGFAFENQIAVAASERRDLAASFSNFGTAADLSAPGDEIMSLAAQGSYAVRSGTSQACPLVAGAVALARALNPTLSAAEIKRLVLSAADEKRGLINFSAHGLRLNVDNIILGKKGQRLPQPDFSRWKSTPYLLESEHPYRSGITQVFDISAPAGSRLFRVRFSEFTTHSADLVEIRDHTGATVALFSGPMGEFWSPVLSADRAQLIFTTDRFISDFGWRIDRLEFLD